MGIDSFLFEFEVNYTVFHLMKWFGLCLSCKLIREELLIYCLLIQGVSIFLLENEYLDLFSACIERSACPRAIVSNKIKIDYVSDFVEQLMF